jgi:putative ABC transport system permease protein
MNYRIQLKQTIKILLKNKLFSWVNITGLSIALTLILMLLVYVKNETSVDSFHVNKDRIYRVLHSSGCAFSPPFGQYIVDNVKGVETYCRTFNLEAVIRYSDNIIRTPNCLFVDSNFFTFFSFPLVQGLPNQVLEAKNNIVISESFARQLFGNDNPIGKSVRYNNRLDFIVTGIVKDFTENTHFRKADIIFPFHAMEDVLMPGYLSQYDLRMFLAGLYVLADKNTDLTQKGNELYNLAKPWYWLFQEKRNTSISFQPLTDAYFNPAPYGYPSGAREGNKRLLNIIVIIVIGISFIAFINYVNLSITQSINRSNEIGIKKISGANKSSIIYQSLFESFILLIISFVISYLLLVISLPAFDNIVGYHISISQLLFNNLILKGVIYILPAGLFIGIVPALVLSRFSPLAVINKSLGRVNIGVVQKVLVVVQYTISIVLIIAMIVIIKQNQFMVNYNLGFNTKETFYVKLSSEFKNNKIAFKDELTNITGIEGVSLCNCMPGEGIWNWQCEYKGKAINLDVLYVDEEYFKVMDIGLKNKPVPDLSSCWINESAAAVLGVKHSGQIVDIEENKAKLRIIVNEVLPDMHFHSLYEKMQPTIFTKVITGGWVDYALIRIQTANTQEVLSKVKKLYKKFSPNFPFEYTFLNTKLNEAYEREIRTSKIVCYFSLFAIFISSLGVFTLAVYSSQKRIKEIGIRKVNGARISKIMLMLNTSFIQWIVIAYILATPIAWYIMRKWLQNFAYKTDLSWWVFVLGGLIALIIALVTISWQSYKAASVNPIKSLRYE